MSRTTKALKRLGVPGLAAVTMVAGLPLFLGTASAAHITGLTLSPDASTDNTGVCVPYTVQIQFASAQQAQEETVDVVLTENTPTATRDVDFCTAATGTTTPATGTDATDTGAAGNGDRAEFRTDANGRVTFGVISNEPGVVNIQAFYETTDNDTFNAGEFQDNSVQTFEAGGTAGSNANQDAANFVEVVAAGEPNPATATVTANGDGDTVVEGETRTYRVFVGSDADSRLAGVTVSYKINSDVNSADRGVQTFGVTDNNGIATGTITFPARTEASGQTTSQDVVTFFVNQSGVTSTPDQDLGEPGDTLTVTVREATLQSNRNIDLQPGSRTVSARETTATFTAVVDDPRTTGADANTNGTLIVFTVSGGSGDETVSPTECSTTANGGTTDANDSSCVVTVTDPTPEVGRVLTVTATVRGTTQSDSSTLTFTNAPTDARFITLTPDPVTVAPNTAQQLTATVTDVDGKPVEGVRVRFTETGAGAFRNGSSEEFRTTNAQGQATIETISLPGETGQQTVTATIVTPDTQCTQAAGQGTDPQGNNLANNTTNPGTEAAGDCDDTATVTFGQQTATPTPTQTTTAPAFTCTRAPSIVVLDDPVLAGFRSRARVTATPGDIVRIDGYSRARGVAPVSRNLRPALTVPASGVLDYSFTPPSNTRLFAISTRNCGSTTDTISVRARVSLNIKKLGARTYQFYGDFLPAALNQGRNVQIFIARPGSNDFRLRANAPVRNAVVDGKTVRYAVTITFSGTGTFDFQARTGNDVVNLASVATIFNTKRNYPIS